MIARIIIYPTESYLKKLTVSQHRNNQTSGSILPANCDIILMKNKQHIMVLGYHGILEQY